MKHLLLLFCVITCFTSLYAQTDSASVYKGLERKKFYSLNLRATSQLGKTKYTVNGKKVSRAKYDKYKVTWADMANCCPCILEYYDQKDRLLREQVSCTDCGVGWVKTYYKNGTLKTTGNYTENPTDDWDDIYNRGYCNVKNGQWTYFDSKGDILYTETWDNGTFLKQEPEQNKMEIWDVGITLDGVAADTLLIPISRIGEIIIEPKFKNSNTDVAFSITFEVSAIGHRPNYKEFTLDSFQSINVKEMLDAVEIPEDKITSFSLVINADGSPFTSFQLTVQR